MPLATTDTAGIFNMYMRRLLQFLGLALVLIVWNAVSGILAHSQLPIGRFLPSPIAVAQAGLKLLVTTDFWTSIITSNARVLTAFSLAMIVGVFLGLLTAWRPNIRALLQPALVLARYTPVAALVPLSIVFFGVNDLQKVIVLFIGTVFYVIVLIQDAVLRFPLTHVDSARSLGLRPVQILTRVILPGVAPEIFDTARVAVGLTWSYVLVAEIVAAQSGMGFLLMRAERFLQMEQMFFITIVLALLGLVYDSAFVFSRRFIFPWV